MLYQHKSPIERKSTDVSQQIETHCAIEDVKAGIWCFRLASGAFKAHSLGGSLGHCVFVLFKCTFFSCYNTTWSNHAHFLFSSFASQIAGADSNTTWHLLALFSAMTPITNPYITDILRMIGLFWLEWIHLLKHRPGSQPRYPRFHILYCSAGRKIGQPKLPWLMIISSFII